VDVVMLSDLHFDPFYDPAKVRELVRSPIQQWPAILSRADSATRLQSFAALQTGCGVRGTDSPWSLLDASLKEARKQQGAPLFVTVSGDLLAHGFICKFRKMYPSASAADASGFAAKSLAFVAQQMHGAYPSTPIYIALGNNDSGCGDYIETPDSGFLKVAGTIIADGLRDSSERSAVAASVSHLGDYTVMLPTPMQKTRLVVLQDDFWSTHYQGCSGARTSAPAEEQMAWLRAQLTQARASDEQVWVMAHIPPGVDVYTTYHRYLLAPGEACHVTQPQMFVTSTALADTIAEFGDVVRLAIFAHTHMDEVKLLEASDGNAVPVKLVPSISPINGNDPSFVVAQVTPQTATLKDYEVYAAANAQGTAWALEYRYSKLYALSDFSAKSVQQLTSDLIDDKAGESETSRAYERNFLAGGGTFAALGLQRLWPEYSCSLRQTDPAAFLKCMCGGAAQTQPAKP
jgi:sphingomyelin phosphodiesterase acid-like 3